MLSANIKVSSHCIFECHVHKNTGGFLDLGVRVLFFQLQTKDIKKSIMLIRPLQPTRNKSMDSVFHHIMTLSCTELDGLIYYVGIGLMLGPSTFGGSNTCRERAALGLDTNKISHKGTLSLLSQISISSALVAKGITKDKHQELRYCFAGREEK